jgi:AraC-like DNA-binding protein
MARRTPKVARPVTLPTDSSATILVADVGDRAIRHLFRAIPVAGLVLRYVDDRARVVADAAAMRPVAVLLPARDRHGVTTAPLTTRLRAEVPDVRAITLWHPERDRDCLVETIRAGGEVVSIRSASDLADVVRGLRRSGALSGMEGEALRSLLADLNPPRLVDMLLSATHSAHRKLSVDDLAELVGVSRRTLARRASAASWPAPEELIDWGRLLRASLIQWREDRSVVALAHASGFASAQALHRAAERLLGYDLMLPGRLAPLGVSAALRRRLAVLGR